MRKKMLAGNWKMNKNLHESILLADDIRKGVQSLSPDRLPFIVLAPAFPFLYSVCQTLGPQTPVEVGAQYCHSEKSGAYTGEVSVEMIRSTGARYVIIGHSERRTFFGETDGEINRKIKVVTEAGLCPIVCIGEKLEERRQNRHFEVVSTQLSLALEQIAEGGMENLILAYEPVWAIGTGVNATSEQAQEMHAFIRKRVGEICSRHIALSIPILYGGSCNPKNASELFACPDVDGGLIGGASLNAPDFISLIKAAMK
ncbi:MAG: triose-phosphate isomerase [Bacteroidia bacterium]